MLSGILVLLGVLTIVVSASVLVTTTASNFTQQIPALQDDLRRTIDELVERAEGAGINVPEDAIDDLFDPARVVGWVGVVLTSLTTLLRSAFFVLITASFILAEASGLPDKVRAISPDPDADLDRFGRVLADMQVYLAVKTQMSIATAFVVGLGMWLLGVPWWPFLALITFLMNYIPTLGSILAAIPAIVIALATRSFGVAALVGLLFIAANTIFGTLLEPRIMGRRVGLSALVVFLSLVFWGWLLGIVGMFLAVPLTMLAKIFLDRSDDMRWLAVLLGPAPSSDAAPNDTAAPVRGTDAAG